MNDSDYYDKIRKQVEYYLSDENLRNDKFFHGKISSAADGAVPLDVFLNCNKIKKMNATLEKLKKSLKDSLVLKLTEDGNGVKRLNSNLPPLRSKQLLLTLDNKKDNSGNENIVVFVPLVLSFPITSEIAIKSKEFEKKIPKLYTGEVPYCKVSKKQGILVFNEKAVDFEALDDFVAQEWPLEKVSIKFTKMDAGETRKWFKNNKPYLEEALKRKYDYTTLKETEGAPVQANIDDNFGPVTIGERQFSDFREAKNFFKGLMARTKNGEKLQESDEAIVKALLAYHTNASEKTKDIIGITVDCHPEYPTTRCFFIQKHDGEEQDFSYFKCLTALYNQLIKK